MSKSFVCEFPQNVRFTQREPPKLNERFGEGFMKGFGFIVTQKGHKFIFLEGARETVRERCR